MFLSRLAGILPLSLLLVTGSPLSAQSTKKAESRQAFVPLEGVTTPGILDQMPSPPQGQSLQYLRPPLPDLPTVSTRVTPHGPPTDLFGSAAPKAATISVFQNRRVLPSGASRSVVGEPSAIQNGFTAFYTGNWYAALSTDDGQSWGYINPYTKFPKLDGGFCCDQYTMYVPSYKLTVWLLQYAYSATTGYGSYRIAIAKNEANLRKGIFHYYSFSPKTFGLGKGYYLDFPNLAYSRTYLYATANIYKGSTYSSTVCWRMPLSKLASGSGFSFSFFRRSGRTWRLTHGATTTMYWWQHVNNTKGYLFQWQDSSSTIHIYSVSVSAWNWGNRGSMLAKDPSGRNWMARADSRPLGAWVSAGKIGVMWNAKQGGSLAYPYIRIIEISEATKKVLRTGDVWNSTYAFSYPSASKNSRGHVAGSFAFGGGSHYPSSAVWIVDDLSPSLAPINAAVTAVGNNSPLAQKWGDYFTSIPHSRMTRTWIATTMIMSGGNTGTYLRPSYVHFGRLRDRVLLPDLVPTALSSSSSVFYHGSSYTLSSTIRNEGTTSAGSSHNGFYLSTNSIITSSDLLIRSFTLPAIGIGSSRSYSSLAYIPSTAPVGNCWLGVYADRDHRLTEWSEINNTMARPVRCMGRPDLIISTVSTSTRVLNAGQRIQLQVTTKNIGRATAGGSITGVMLSTNSIISTMDDFLGGYFLPTLLPGRSLTRTISGTLPYYLIGSPRYLGAYADVSETITEVSESNNSRARIPAIPVRSLTSGEFLQYRHPVYTNFARMRGPYTWTSARLRAATGGSAPMYLIAPRRRGYWYLLVMSGRRPFVFDSLSSFGLGVLNTAMFPLWLSRTNAIGLGAPGLNLPRVHLTGPLTVFIYSAWFDPSFTTFLGFGSNSLYLRVER